MRRHIHRATEVYAFTFLGIALGTLAVLKVLLGG